MITPPSFHLLSWTSQTSNSICVRAYKFQQTGPKLHKISAIKQSHKTSSTSRTRKKFHKRARKSFNAAPNSSFLRRTHDSSTHIYACILITKKIWIIVNFLTFVFLERGNLNDYCFCSCQGWNRRIFELCKIRKRVNDKNRRRNKSLRCLWQIRHNGAD